jgi:hypothetical protein
LPDEHEGGDASEGQAKAMHLDEGMAGRPDVARTEGHIQIKDHQLDPQLARQPVIDDGRPAELFGNTAALVDAIAHVTATADMSSGPDAVNTWGAIYGADTGPSHGYFGMGRMGFGIGGGCTEEPCGIIGGKAGYGTIGTGEHAGSGYRGPGGMGNGIGRHVPVVPRPTIGQPTGGDGLDKSIIRRYIKRNIDKIAYCYEHELLAHSTLAGEITVQFFITPSGTVTGAKGAGFDPTVATCVAGVIGDIEFPKPKSGGGVTVNYPFTFHPAGQ